MHVGQLASAGNRGGDQSGHLLVTLDRREQMPGSHPLLLKSEDEVTEISNI